MATQLRRCLDKYMYEDTVVVRKTKTSNYWDVGVISCNCSTQHTTGSQQWNY